MRAVVNPRVDIAFKKIFGVEENKDLLMSLINAIVSEEDQVSDITVLNPYNFQNFCHEKLSILDIKATDKQGKRFNIEIQMADEADYDKRALYYWAKLYTEQLMRRDDYSQLEKAIGIHILNFLSIPEAKNYHNVFHIAEKETGITYFRDLELHTIELRKFCPNTREDLSEFIKRVKNALDMWLAFLTRHDLLEETTELPKPLNDPSLKKAMNVITTMNLTPEEYEAHEAHLKWLRMETSAIRKIESDRKKIEIEKFEKGKAEGILEEKRQIAKTMIAKGINTTMIADITGLSLTEVGHLKEN